MKFGGTISKNHSPHLQVGAPGIFLDLLRSAQMLKREWGTEGNGKLPRLFIPGKTAALFPEFAVQDLPSAQLKPRFLRLGWTLWWWIFITQINPTDYFFHLEIFKFITQMNLWDNFVHLETSVSIRKETISSRESYSSGDTQPFRFVNLVNSLIHQEMNKCIRQACPSGHIRA